MKKTAIYIISLFILLTLGSCTRNHGDIGIWFGTWHVEQITVGGSPENVLGDYFFQFQSKVFRVSKVYGHEQLVESYGTWEESGDGNTLTVTFPDASVYYIDMLGLEARNEFTIHKGNHGQVELTKVMDDGTTYAYILKKQP